MIKFKVQSEDDETRFIIGTGSRIPTTHLGSKVHESEAGLPTFKFEDTGDSAIPVRGESGAFEDKVRNKIYRFVE